MTLQPHQTRVLEERNHLKEKLDKLTAFLGTGPYKVLDMDEQGRLCRQAAAMTEYLSILNQRIAAWGA